MTQERKTEIKDQDITMGERWRRRPSVVRRRTTCKTEAEQQLRIDAVRYRPSVCMYCTRGWNQVNDDYFSRYTYTSCLDLPHSRDRAEPYHRTQHQSRQGLR